MQASPRHSVAMAMAMATGETKYGSLPFELLLIIFEQTDIFTQKSASSVCWLWYEAAQSAIWRHTSSLQGLFRRLVPLTNMGDNTMGFLFEPEPEDWAHFTPIARRVISLTIDEWEPSLDARSIELIQLTNPNPEIFPSLRNLRLFHKSAFRREEHLMLLTPNLTRLSFDCEDPAFVLLSWKQIASMKDLRELALEGVFEPEDQISAIKSAVLELSFLEKISLRAPTSAIGALFDTLSTIPRIRRIQFEQDQDRRQEWSRPHLVRREFPQVQAIISARTSFNFVLNLLTSFTFIGLRDLNVALTSGEYLYAKIFSAIATACPSLTMLRIYFQLKGGTSSLDFVALKPIVNNLALCTFSVHDHLPLNLGPNDILRIATKWGPTIETLDLNARPESQAASGLTLNALQLLAKYCPRLKKLGICLDATQPCDSPFGGIRFPSTLREIDFGYSDVGLEVRHIINFLYDITESDDTELHTLRVEGFGVQGRTIESGINLRRRQKHTASVEAETVEDVPQLNVHNRSSQRPVVRGILKGWANTRQA